MKSLTLKNSAKLLHQDCVGVVWSDFVDGDQTTHQLSSDSLSNVGESWLVHRNQWNHTFPTELHPLQTREKNRNDFLTVHNDLFWHCAYYIPATCFIYQLHSLLSVIFDMVDIIFTSIHTVHTIVLSVHATVLFIHLQMQNIYMHFANNVCTFWCTFKLHFIALILTHWKLI